MKQGEITDLKQNYPFFRTVLNLISKGIIIKREDPLWPTYLLARQRGLVKREGKNFDIITVSPRGNEFIEKS